MLYTRISDWSNAMWRHTIIYMSGVITLVKSDTCYCYVFLDSLLLNIWLKQYVSLDIYMYIDVEYRNSFTFNDSSWAVATQSTVSAASVEHINK